MEIVGSFWEQHIWYFWIRKKQLFGPTVFGSEKQDVQKIVENICDYDDETRFMILSPIIRHMKGQHLNVIEKIKS